MLVSRSPKKLAFFRSLTDQAAARFLPRAAAEIFGRATMDAQVIAATAGLKRFERGQLEATLAPEGGPQ